MRIAILVAMLACAVFMVPRAASALPALGSQASTAKQLNTSAVQHVRKRGVYRKRLAYRPAYRVKRRYNWSYYPYWRPYQYHYWQFYYPYGGPLF